MKPLRLIACLFIVGAVAAIAGGGGGTGRSVFNNFQIPIWTLDTGDLEIDPALHGSSTDELKVDGNLEVSGAAVFAAMTFSGDVDIDDGAGDSPALYLRDGDDYVLRLLKLTAGAATIYNDEGGLSLLLNNDLDDTLDFSTVANVPTIGTTGSCNLNIRASGGTVDFDDEAITTTGTVTVGTITDGTVSVNAGSVTGTWVDLGSITTADINGGTVDGVTIGGAAAGAITGTTITGTTVTDGTWTTTAGVQYSTDKLTLEASGVDAKSPVLDFIGDTFGQPYNATIGADTGGSLEIIADDSFLMKLNSDLDDYAYFSTSGNEPWLQTSGGCNLNIRADGGTIDFGDDHITTTGTVTGNTITDGTLSSTGGTITGAGSITASATIQAEQLTSTDDASVTDRLNVDTVYLGNGDDPLSLVADDIIQFTSNDEAGTLRLMGFEGKAARIEFWEDEGDYASNKWRINVDPSPVAMGFAIENFLNDPSWTTYLEIKQTEIDFGVNTLNFSGFEIEYNSTQDSIAIGSTSSTNGKDGVVVLGDNVNAYWNSAFVMNPSGNAFASSYHGYMVRMQIHARTAGGETGAEMHPQDNASYHVTIPTDTSMTYVLKVSATAKTVGHSGSWVVHGGIENVGGTTALVGTPDAVSTNLGSGAGAWTVTVTADDANDSLLVTVDGDVSLSVQWAGLVDALFSKLL